jgi:predicted DNA-binding transcriptional regulator AlpA
MHKREILQLLDITPRTLRLWVAADRFPKPIPIGRRRQFWVRADVMRALGQREKRKRAEEV